MAVYLRTPCFLKVGDIPVHFEPSASLASWAGSCPDSNKSAGKLLSKESLFKKRPFQDCRGQNRLGVCLARKDRTTRKDTYEGVRFL